MNALVIPPPLTVVYIPPDWHWRLHQDDDLSGEHVDAQEHRYLIPSPALNIASMLSRWGVKKKKGPDIIKLVVVVIIIIIIEFFKVIIIFI